MTHDLKVQKGENGEPLCPRCEHIELGRRHRRGLWQRLVLGRLGYFPWQCSLCRETYLLRQRSAEQATPPAEQDAPMPACLPVASSSATRSPAQDSNLSSHMKTSASETDLPAARKKKA